MKDDKKLFRTSVNGFNKSDVTAYIEELGFQLTASKREKDEAERQHNAKINELNETIKELNEKYDALERNYNKERAEMADIKSVSAASAQEITKTKYLYEQERAKNADLARRLHDFEQLMPEFKEKADKYERQMSKISEVLVSVRQQSDEIIKSANEKTSEIRNNLISDVRAAGDYINSLKQAYTDAKDEISFRLSDINSKMGTGMVTLEQLQNKIKDLELFNFEEECPVEELEEAEETEKQEEV
ncbi:MAG: hypothetical protein Q8865_08795 [Bacillota bacterium]|nr:hypothetical protein [Bacillota bacterium]